MLSRYADIFSGYTYRSSFEENAAGVFTFLQPRDINQTINVFSLESAAKTNDYPGDKKFLLRKGDVLVAIKGKTTPVVIYDSSLPHVIGSSAFAIIRTMPAYLDPGYLAWYLEQPDVQQYFLSRKAGTTVLNLPITVIQQLEIPLPDLHKQKIYGELYYSKNKLKATHLAILEKEIRLIDLQLSDMLKKENL